MRISDWSSDVCSSDLPSNSLASQSRCAAKPASVSKLVKGCFGTCVASQPRISSRNLFCRSVYSNLMHARPVQARAIAGADIQNKQLACLLLSSFLFFEAYVALFDERAARFRGILFALGLPGEALFPAVLEIGREHV